MNKLIIAVTVCTLCAGNAKVKEEIIQEKCENAIKQSYSWMEKQAYKAIPTSFGKYKKIDVSKQDIKKELFSKSKAELVNTASIIELAEQNLKEERDCEKLLSFIEVEEVNDCETLIKYLEKYKALMQSAIAVSEMTIENKYSQSNYSIKAKIRHEINGKELFTEDCIFYINSNFDIICSRLDLDSLSKE